MPLPIKLNKSQQQDLGSSLHEKKQDRIVAMEGAVNSCLEIIESNRINSARLTLYRAEAIERAKYEQSIGELILESLALMKKEDKTNSHDKTVYIKDQKRFNAFEDWIKNLNNAPFDDPFNEDWKKVGMAVENLVSQQEELSPKSREIIDKYQRKSVYKQLRQGLAMGICLTVGVPLVATGIGIIPGAILLAGGAYFGHELYYERSARNEKGTKELIRFEESYQTEAIRVKSNAGYNPGVKPQSENIAALLERFEEVLILKVGYDKQLNNPSWNLLEAIKYEQSTKSRTMSDEQETHIKDIINANIDLLRADPEKEAAIKAIKEAYKKLDELKAPKTWLGSILPGAASLAYGAVVGPIMLGVSIAAAPLITIMALGLKEIPPTFFSTYYTDFTDPAMNVYRYFFNKSMLGGTLEHAARQVADSYQHQTKVSATFEPKSSTPPTSFQEATGAPSPQIGTQTQPKSSPVNVQNQNQHKPLGFRPNP